MKILIGIAPGDVAEPVIELAIKHAKHFDAKVYLLTSLEGGHVTSEKEVERAEKALRYAEGIFEKAGISCENHLLVRGRAPEIDILEFSEENRMDEIIMGARKRSPVGKALLGSVTQRVALAAGCPVVLVK